MLLTSILCCLVTESKAIQVDPNAGNVVFLPIEARQPYVLIFIMEN